MAGSEDGDAPEPEHVTAGRDAYIAGRDLHVHPPPDGQSRQQRDGADDELPAIPRLTAGEWHPLDLGVHRPIDTHADTELPPYICRSHDRELREILSAAPASGMVILVGGSCTGKSRACYEAVRKCLPDWMLSHPADAPELERLLTGQRSGERMLVWLDEADRYLGGAARGLQRALVGSPGPLLVIGSMQSGRWAKLTAEPEGGDADPYPHARRLLGMHTVRRILVPENFSSADPADLRELALAADRDPRLAAAQRAGGDTLQITQVLAGGVLLLDRYLHPPDPGSRYSREVVTAAMDARRLGHQDPVPPSLLEEAVAGALTPRQRAAPPDSLRQGLIVAAKPVRGVSALTPVRVRPGIGAPDGYVLHDYLDEYARDTRGAIAPPVSLWEALLAHTAGGADLARIADEARIRGLYRYAVLAAARAAAAGDAGSVLFVARFLDETGRVEECIAWLLPFAEAGDEDALLFLSEELQKSSRENRYLESASWDRRAAESGSTRAMWKLAEFLGRAELAARFPELVEEGTGWLRRLAERGDPRAMKRLAGLLEDTGRDEEASFWQDQRARAPRPRPAEPEDREGLMRAFRELDELLTFPVEDAPTLRNQAVAGDLRAMERLGVRLFKEGHSVEAADWLARAAEAGWYGAALELAGILHRANRGEEALTVLRQAAACWGDHFSSLDVVLPLLRELGGPPAVEHFLMAAAQAGNGWAAAYLAPGLAKQGRAAEAIGLLRPAAEKKNLGAMEFLGVLLEETGHDVEARDWFQHVDQTVSVRELFLLGSLLQGASWPERALIRYRHAVECQENSAMQPLTDLLKEMGRTDEAERLRVFGIDPGGRTSQQWPVPSSEPIARSAYT